MFKLLLVALAWTSPVLAATPDALRKDIHTILAQPHMAASKVGIIAIDTQTKDTLFEHQPDLLLNPASNTKLVTAAATLEVLGPEWTVFTRVSHDGNLKENTLTGNLWVKSDGDPNLQYADMVAWAIEVRRAGIQKINGDLIVDDTSFAPGFTPPAFDQKNEDAAYRALIGALSVGFNAVRVEVHPGTTGQPANIRLYPPNDYVQIVNKTTTQAGKQSRIAATATAKGDLTEITLTGTIGTQAEATSIRKRIDHPSLFAAAVFKQALEATGIELTGTTRTGTRPEATRTLVLHESRPMWTAVADMNKWSNNFVAEMLFRLIGRGNGPASTSHALDQITGVLNKAGLKPGWAMVNGSGLYDGNLFSARQLAQLLVFMQSHSFAAEFAMSLPIAGRDGTLKSRLADTSLRGKTGTLNHVAALAGYMTTQSGRHLAYVVIFNDTPVRAWNLRQQQDDIVRLISRF